MKTLIVALLLVSSSAMAAKFSEMQDFEYLSWCEDNKVTASDDRGVSYVKADCSAEGLVCKAKPYYFVDRQVFAATCVKAPQQ